MKHEIINDVSMNLNVVLPTEDLERLVGKITDSVIVIIAAATVAHILRRLV